MCPVPSSHLARVSVLFERKQRVADAEVGQRVGGLHPHRGLEGVDGLTVPALGWGGVGLAT